ncbi:trafficking protein particle complex subunit 2-related [Anaeramoeba flamelloides]|uniref:Trafficking protein particle complex subunit 2-related n=1 Tax=Anaeramoeba flamelloides TaxID=1746091 RepID=A0AAV8AEX2_9EUKA|nr:trafficking protein particle complex subunit 2-related [Anaeramoeba flamelloides]KAJ3451277.1 trafficking protein particle complex subunit 2-related [Anaeramoeba flamelloides]KAJ6240911.1 trafficking protein particle complex subunit 2-related [Anaeramoeba flamelloides]KAJ6252662.1 trafficking protein particle complex subunit 2-related [Anaeramoeba flamelloides]
MISTFMIIGKDDVPLYEASFFNSKKQKEGSSHLSQFVIHAALDIIEEKVLSNENFFLGVVDNFNNFTVSAFVTTGMVKFVLLTENKNVDSTKAFFNDVYELYLKVILNPFYKQNSPIVSPYFDKKVREKFSK